MFKTCSCALLTLLLFASNNIFSQHDLSGKVSDGNNEPVVFANVILLNAQDSTRVYKGTVSSEQGRYEFENIEKQNYLLKISFVGYKDFLKKVSVSGDTGIEDIVLEEDTSQLDEITVKTRKPKITRSIDRIIFEVANTSLSSGNSWEILRKTPGVIENQGQLQIRNSAAVVYINDRKVQLSPAELKTLLESYSAANIKSVEVITNPPARYDAEGGAVLNIVTTKPLTSGYKGSLEGNYTQAVFPKYQLGTSHYLKTDKLNIFANYNISPRKEFKQDDSHINFINEQNEIFSRWNTKFERVTRSQAHNANVVMDYFFNDRNTLSFSSNATISPKRTFNNNVYTEVRNAQSQLDSTFNTISHLEDDQTNLAIDLTYKHQLKKEGAQISANVHYTTYEQDRVQNVSTDYFSPDDELLNNISFFTDALQDINIYTARIDFVSPLGNSNFESGVKTSVIDSESGIDFLNAESLESLYDNLSDNFLYDERVYAGYASLSKDWKKWSAKAGLRGEYTDLEGVSRSMNEINTKEYFELFPTFYLQRRISENHSLTLDYSRRINRPRYESLNPFRYFLNETNYNAGNPNLRAAISNNFNLNYALKKQYFFDLYYRDNGNQPETIGFQDNERLSLRNVSTNLAGSKSYGLDILHGRSLTGFWYSQAFVSFFHEENTFLAVESGNQEVTNEVDGVFAQIFNNLTLSKDGSFSGEVTFTYISDYISGSYDLDPVATLSIGFRKTFWNRRAELSLNFEDILDKTNTRLTSRYLNQDNSFFAQEEMRYVRLGFKYDFGNFRLKDNQRNVEVDERERL